MNTQWPHIIYPISGDPSHGGHYNIARKWEEEFWRPVNFLIGKNPLKTDGLLTPEQRYNDLIISLVARGIESGEICRDNLSQKIIEIASRIILWKGPVQMLWTAFRSDRIIRWARNEHDREYSIDVARKIGRFGISRLLLRKGVFVKQDLDFLHRSSTSYKLAFPHVAWELRWFPDIYNWLNFQEIISVCENLLQNTQGIPTNIWELGGDIQQYMELVKFLEVRWWLKNLPQYFQ